MEGEVRIGMERSRPYIVTNIYGEICVKHITRWWYQVNIKTNKDTLALNLTIIVFVT